MTNPIDPKASDIFNGARCKTYSWSQSHGDLEIRIMLAKAIEQNQISVSLTKEEICVNVMLDCTKETILRGRFKHKIDVESAFWLVERETLQLTIFIDKAEEMWWTELLENEQVSLPGPRCYTVPMDHMDQGTRMVIEKLIKSQKDKLAQEAKTNSLSPA